MRRLNVCPIRSLPPGERVLLEAAGQEIVVFNVDGRLCAVQNRCPHAGARLYMSGSVRGHELVCDWHDLAFCLRTGQSDAGFQLRVYPAGVDEAGNVWVEL
jgi:nitrite reductase/ring-hydroxylating ferredoxin subunit